jgi:lipid A 3-O-deacylase
MIRKTALAAVLALGPVSSAWAVDGISLEAGAGNESTEIWRAGLQWKWQRRWFAERAWTLGAYWDLQAGRWRGPLRRGQQGAGNQELWDIAITPVFRLERAERSRLVPYVEAAIGFHMLSDLRINFRRSFSTHFQYGDHLGAGVRFGVRHHWDAGVRLQHLSNGGIAKPNPGINFVQLRLAYHF